MRKAYLSLEFILAFTAIVSITLFLLSSFFPLKQKMYSALNELSEDSFNDFCLASIDSFAVNISGQTSVRLFNCKKKNSLTDFSFSGNKIQLKKSRHYLGVINDSE